jgi:hypothetical protein
MATEEFSLGDEELLGTSLIREGYLQKKSSGKVQRWQKRYFELRGDRLRYLQSQGARGDGQGAKELDLTTMRDVRRNGMELNILLGSKMVNLKASTDDDAQLWLTDFQTIRERLSRQNSTETLNVYRKNSNTLLGRTRTRSSSNAPKPNSGKQVNSNSPVVKQSSREHDSTENTPPNSADSHIIVPKWLGKLQRNAATITELDLSNEGVTAEMCSQIADLLDQTSGCALQSLNMSSNPVFGRKGIDEEAHDQGQGLIRLTTALASPQSPSAGLSVLNLSQCWLGSEGAVTVARFIEQSNHLRSIELKSNFMSTSRAHGYDDSGIRALAAAFTKNESDTLAYIGLANNGLCGRWVSQRHMQGLNALLDMLKGRKSAIETIDLSENMIQDDGLDLIVDLWSGLEPSLNAAKSLKLWYNAFTPKGIQVLTTKLGKFQCTTSVPHLLQIGR